MNVLVLGGNTLQLNQWRDRNFVQGDLYRQTSGTLVRGDDTYLLIVSRPQDDRVRGLEFGRLIILEGAIDHAGQYSMRVRP